MIEKIYMGMFVWLSLSTVEAGQFPKVLDVWRGATPTLDGQIAPGEYADAVHFSSDDGTWISRFDRPRGDKDLLIEGWAKHDGTNLFFAFRIKDDVLYGIDTPKWLPKDNPHAHELTPRGFPWFGDAVELLINASNRWEDSDRAKNKGNASCWQMVCNLTKSRLGGIGTGGMLEGEERSNPVAWKTYRSWILKGDMQAVAKPFPKGGGYVVEWMIHPRNTLHVACGCPWNPRKTARMGFNIAVQDLDEEHKGWRNPLSIHCEEWWAGVRNLNTAPRQWGTLVIHPERHPETWP